MLRFLFKQKARDELISFEETIALLQQKQKEDWAVEEFTYSTGPRLVTEKEVSYQRVVDTLGVHLAPYVHAHDSSLKGVTKVRVREYVGKRRFILIELTQYIDNFHEKNSKYKTARVILSKI